MSGSRRPFNTPQTESGSDTQVGQSGPNTVKVIGITGTPFQSTNPPNASSEGLLCFADPSGNFLTWASVQTLIDSGIVGDILNRITIDKQGLVIEDQQGNIIFQ